MVRSVIFRSYRLRSRYKDQKSPDDNLVCLWFGPVCLRKGCNVRPSPPGCSLRFKVPTHPSPDKLAYESSSHCVARSRFWWQPCCAQEACKWEGTLGESAKNKKIKYSIRRGIIGGAPEETWGRSLAVHTRLWAIRRWSWFLDKKSLE